MIKLLKRYIAMWCECFRNAEDECDKVLIFGVFILTNAFILLFLFGLIATSFECPVFGICLLVSIGIPCIVWATCIDTKDEEDGTGENEQ